MMATVLLFAVAKSFPAKEMSVFGMVVSALAMPPIKIEVALKLAAMMNASVLRKCGFCKGC